MSCFSFTIFSPRFADCLAYIDLNPVRAGIVEKPEDYRWNSIGYFVQTNNKDDFLSLDFSLKEFNVLDADERLRLYRKFLYEKGANSKDSGCHGVGNDTSSIIVWKPQVILSIKG